MPELSDDDLDALVEDNLEVPVALGGWPSPVT